MTTEMPLGVVEPSLNQAWPDGGSYVLCIDSLTNHQLEYVYRRSRLGELGHCFGVLLLPSRA